MENEFDRMTAAEVAEAIFDCACDNAQEYEEVPYDRYGYLDPRGAYVAGCGCENAKLALGEHLTLRVSAEFAPDGECRTLSVSIYDIDEEVAERYETSKSAIKHALQQYSPHSAISVE